VRRCSVLIMSGGPGGVRPRRLRLPELLLDVCMIRGPGPIVGPIDIGIGILTHPLTVGELELAQMVPVGHEMQGFEAEQ
jgi:hypothetical protein